MLETKLSLPEEIKHLGRHHDFSIEVSFPIEFTQEMFNGKDETNTTNTWMSYVMNTLYGRNDKHDIFRVRRYSGDDWPSQIECQIARAYTSLVPREDKGHMLRPIPRRHMTHSGGQDSFYFEFGYLIGEALANAIKHGNKMDPRKKAVIGSHLGENGLIFSIEDEGEGFDVESIANSVNSGKRVKDSGGWGSMHFSEGVAPYSDLKLIRCKPPRIGYNDKGNVWAMIYPFSDCRYTPLVFHHTKREFGSLVLPEDLELYSEG